MQRALADRERRLDADAHEPRLDLLDTRMMRLSQLLGGRPPLPTRADVLALVEAYRAAGRRFGARSELRAACHTDVGRHASGPAYPWGISPFGDLVSTGSAKDHEGDPAG